MVPVIAAEYLKVPVAKVLEDAEAGLLPSKKEHGFLFVQLPWLGAEAPAKPKPATFVEAPAEVDAEEATAEDEAALDWRTTRERMAQARRGPGVRVAA